MKNQSRKTLALILAVLLMMGLFPTAGFATVGDEPATASPIETPTQTLPPETPAPSGTPGATPESTPAPTESPEATESPLPTESPVESPLPTETPVPVQIEKSLALFERLMDCATLEEMEAIFAEYAEEELDALMQLFTQEQRTALEAHIAAITPALEEFIPPVDFTNAAPFMPPVTGAAMHKAARSFGVQSVEGEVDPQPHLHLDKTAKNNGDGTYTVTLEAYTTGTVTPTITNVPADIVLVLDQSGSMARCLVCGQTIPDGGGKHTVYKPENNPSTTGTYFYMTTSGSYARLYYCVGGSEDYNGFHHKGKSDLWHQPGWYTSTHTKNDASGTRYEPKTSANPSGTQFYVQVQEDHTSRLESLKTALRNFRNNVAEKARGTDNILGTLDDVNHRIAVVGFASAGNNTNTELFIGTTQYPYNDGGEGDGTAFDKYSDAFQDMNDENDIGNITASIDALAANGHTRTDYGVTMANNILSEPFPAGNRNRIIIVFTDGVPTTDTAFSDMVANYAITQTNKAKAPTTDQGYGATVYTVGVFSGADPTTAGSNSIDSNETQKANWFMQQMSSNNGAVSNPSYYLAASNTGALNNIFKQISDNIVSPAISLDGSTQIRDIISPYFKLKNVANNIRLYTADANAGGTTFGQPVLNPAGVTASIGGTDDKTITVTGFNYDANFVSANSRPGTNDYGRKLIIDLDVVPEPGFLGGNNVPTNAETSGVYVPGGNPELVEHFPRPKVNVTTKAVNTVVAPDKNVYLLGDLTQAQLLEYATATVGGYSLDLDALNYGLDEWQNAYVNIATAFTPPIGAGGLSNLTQNEEYSLTVTVSPKAGSDGSNANAGTAAQTETGSDGFNINVFKPEITTQNLAVYLTNPVTLANAVTGVTWKHATATGAILGGVPSLEYGFSPSTEYPTADTTTVTITSVKRADKETELISHSTIKNAGGGTTTPHFTVYVYKPIVTATDYEVFLGDTTNLANRYSFVADNLDSWYASSGAPEPSGDEPDLTLTPVYVRGTDPEGNGGIAAYAPKLESDFTVNVEANGAPITDYTKFITEEYPLPNGVIGIPTGEDGHHFTIKIRTGTLTIEKSGGTAGESYIFTITGDNGLTFFEVIQGNGSKLITGLPKGTYTVTEDTNWSWRYKNPVVTPAGGQTLGNKDRSGAYMTEITFKVENINRVPFWLSGESFAVNKFGVYPVQ